MGSFPNSTVNCFRFTTVTSVFLSNPCFEWGLSRTLEVLSLLLELKSIFVRKRSNTKSASLEALFATDRKKEIAIFKLLSTLHEASSGYLATHESVSGTHGFCSYYIIQIRRCDSLQTWIVMRLFVDVRCKIFKTETELKIKNDFCTSEDDLLELRLLEKIILTFSLTWEFQVETSQIIVLKARV